jgi:electron transfer flavoprotein alpha subunit
MSEKRLTIDSEKCIGCGACVKVCPFAAMEMVEKLPVVSENCTLCGACLNACKFDAIVVHRPGRGAAGLDAWRGVWVFGEQIGGEVQSVVYELIGAGRRVADTLGEPLGVVVLGSDLEAACASLTRYPVDEVVRVEDAALADYAPEPYAAVLADLARREKPAVVLAGATAIGRSLLPRVAVEAQTGLTADCTGLEVTEDRLLLQTRPAFGGNIMASILCANHRPQMATVRHKVMDAAAAGSGHGARVRTVRPAAELLVSRTQRLAWLPDEAHGANLAEADVIVSGGRGVGGPEGFRLVEALAEALDGAVGASRAVVDAGWYPYSHQVGQTGKTVKPRLYVACGISGAVQHLVGMGSSDVIVAINRDPEAPIFRHATFGIVGDVREVLPALTRELSRGGTG